MSVLANAVNADQHGIGTIASFPGLNCVRVGGEKFLCSVSKDNSDGDPTAPSMKVLNPHRRSFLWAVAAGTRTVQVRVKYSPNVSGRRPKLIVRANSDIGVSSDSSATAPSGSGWVVIGPITVSPTFDGVLEVELQFDHIHQNTQTAHWDSVEVT